MPLARGEYPGLGWLPDPPDKRDLLATSKLMLPPAPPAAAIDRALLGSVFNQGSLGSCTAQAVAKVLYVSHARQGEVNLEIPSRLALYYLARATHHTQRFDSGTYLRANFLVLNKFGFCPEHEWPYDIGKFADMPPMKAFVSAFDQRKPTSYYRIHEAGDARLDACRRAIAAGYPVAFGTKVAHTFVTGNPDIVWNRPTGAIAGGHAMVLVGYAEDGTFTLMNSWGRGWGEGGFARITPEYLAWEDTHDLWVAEHAPPYSQ